MLDFTSAPVEPIETLLKRRDNLKAFIEEENSPDYEGPTCLPLWRFMLDETERQIMQRQETVGAIMLRML